MSGRYLVMPRGINVGARNRVPMTELRSKLTEAGHSDPVTILQSGNVIITSECADTASLSSSIEQLLGDEFGVNVPCLARTAEQVEAVLERDPLGDVADDGSRYLVNFLSQEPDAEAVRSLCEADHEPEVVHVEGSEVYVWTPQGVKAMRLVVLVSRKALRRDRHRPQLEHPQEDRSEALTPPQRTLTSFGRGEAGRPSGPILARRMCVGRGGFEPP